MHRYIVMRFVFWFILFAAFKGECSVTHTQWGYVDSLGNYKWHSGKTDSIFVDASGMKWLKWGEDSLRWEAAMHIYRSSTHALMALGFDSSLVVQQVRLFEAESVLFDLLVHVRNPEYFVSNWKTAFNSYNMTFSARLSPKPDKTSRFALKWYPDKKGISGANALGLVKADFLSHIIEAIRSKGSSIRAIVLSALGCTSAKPYNIYLYNARTYLREVGEL